MIAGSQPRAEDCDGAVTITLPVGATLTLTSTAAAELERALRQHRQVARPKRDLAAEIEAFLTAGPATVPEVARAIGARDSDVRHALRTSPRFTGAPATSDRSPRAGLWMLGSGPSGVGPAAGTSTGDEGP